MMKGRRTSVIMLLILVLAIAGCGRKPSSEDEEFITKTNFIMGTMVTVRVYGENRSAAGNEIIEELKRLEGLMSINIEDSEINEVNRNAGVKPVKVSDDTFKVVSTAFKYAEKTDGLFDPTIGPLVNLWGIGSKRAHIPAQEEIDAVLPLVNYKNVVLNSKAKTIYLTQPGMIIDVGGIAKGYAADCGVEIFKKYKVRYGYINIGGNVIVHGTKPDQTNWRIGIQDPRNTRGDYMGVVIMRDMAVVTSGDYERFFIKDDVRYHHILNPRTGYPVDSGLISASILGANSMEADALSTSVFLLGAEKGEGLAEEQGYSVILISSDKKTRISPELEKNFEFVNEEYAQ